ncbi:MULTISPECIES: hypothetical protein [Catenuloplanes]|uniref:Lipoprotein n=1 Tax=Catenuloplanes niger TaxID=587534 RepID=A0AAE3ZX98_9ACTN|nr:hypothetical protein [Catenuloplanes niger]MDR7327541.1 hypothetical protein [Catenuloplanes niger]
MRRAQILTATIVMMTVSACGSADPQPAVTPSATVATSPPTAIATSAAGPVSSIAAEAGTACELAAEAPRTGEAIDIDEQAIKAIIDNAGKSGIESIAQAGTQVQTRYAAWLGAPIGDESANALDDLLDAVAVLNGACIDAAVPAS